MKRLSIVILLTITSAVAFAQRPEAEQRAKINKVLQEEEQYLYGDETCADLNRAVEGAKKILAREVEQFLAQQNLATDDEEMVSGIITKNMVQVTVARGDKYRAFVYVSKKDITSFNSEMLQEVSERHTEEQPVEEVRKEQPQWETIPSASQSETRKEEPKHVPVGVSTVRQGEPVRISSKNEERYNESVTDINDLLNAVATCRMKNQLSDMIRDFQKDSVGIVYRQHLSPTNTEYYLVCYKRDGTIKAILTPSGEGNVTNVYTGQPDDAKNYPGCAFDGFKITDK